MIETYIETGQLVSVCVHVVRGDEFDEATCRDRLLHDAEKADADAFRLYLGRLDVQLRSQEPYIQIKTQSRIV